MKPSEIAFGLIRIPIDFLMALLAFIAAYKIRAITNLFPGIQLPFDVTTLPSMTDYLSFSMTAVTALLILAALNKMYSLKTTFKTSKEIEQILVVTTTWLMAMIAWFFLTRSFPFSRLALVYTWVLTIVFMAIGRLIIRLALYFTLKAGVGKKNLLFIGHNKITERLSNMVKNNISYNVVGYIDEQKSPHSTLPYLGTLEHVEKIIQEKKIEEILQTKTDLGHQRLANLLACCREYNLGFSFVPSLLEVQQTNIETETWDGIPVIKLKPTPLDGWGRVLKRVFDFISSLLGLIILSPVFLIIAIAIKLNSKGTIFFKYLDDGSRVKRVGEQGKLFYFYKFRTMYPNTHNLRYTELATHNIRKNSPLVKIKDDPRVTSVGKFLRKTSLDELPQLLNVLKGEMSLVGPRPHLPEEVEKYQKHHKFVLTIKPGITGMAQTRGRSDLDFEEEVRLDTYYIEHWSLWLDLKLLLKTVLVFMKGYQE